MRYNARSVISAILCIAMILSLAVCVYAETGETNNELSLQTVQFDRSEYTLKIGQKISTRLIATPTDATYSAVSYTSLKPSVVTIDASGVITAVGTGTATITAVISSQISASATVTVSSPSTKFKTSDVPDSVEKLISGFTVGMTVEKAKSELSKDFLTENIIIQKTNGSIASDSDILSTGMNISTDYANYTVVIKGDVNGDGKITMDDTRTLVNYISGAASYPGAAFIEAASLKNSYVETRKLPDIESSFLISRHVLGKYKITQ